MLFRQLIGTGRNCIICIGDVLSSFYPAVSLKDCESPNCRVSKKSQHIKMRSIGMNELRSNTKYDHLIPEVREKLYAKLQEPANQGTYYESDLEKAMISTWAVRRFLLKHHSADSTACAMVKAYQWFKKMQLRDTDSEDLIAEMYSVGGVFRYENDRAGRPTIYFRLCKHHSVKEMSKLLVKHVYRLIREADDDSGDKGLTIVADLNGLTVSNIDIEICLAMARARDYFVHNVVAIIIIDLPWIAKAAQNMVKYALPTEVRLAFINASKKELTNYIDQDNLPDFLGGNCSRPHSGTAAVPSGCRTFAEYARKQLNLSDERIGKIINIYSLDSADADPNNN